MQRRFFSLSLSLSLWVCILYFSVACSRFVYKIYFVVAFAGACARSFFHLTCETYAANMDPVNSPLRCVPWIPSKLKANPIPNEYEEKNLICLCDRMYMFCLACDSCFQNQMDYSWNFQWNYSRFIKLHVHIEINFHHITKSFAINFKIFCDQFGKDL